MNDLLKTRALVNVDGKKAAILQRHLQDDSYSLQYFDEYEGQPISLTLPVRGEAYLFDSFPPFFDGLLPEGFLLSALLRKTKLDRSDYFGQLLEIGSDLPGNVTVEEQRTGTP